MSALSKCLSLVVPVLNEQDSINAFLERARPCVAAALAMIGADSRAEFLFVDDGSSDRTPAILAILSGLDPSIRSIRLSRNFGKEAALAAGLRHALGDAVIPIDVDLQDPPELIPAMVSHWLAGAKVVNARRIDRTSDSRFKRWTAKLFYRVINQLAETPIPENVGDYRLLDRAAVDVINQLGETARFNKGLFSWIGFRVAEVGYGREMREAGETKWRIGGLWNLALDGITSSTTVPLRIWTYVGALVAVAAMGFAAFLFLRALVTETDTPGYASIMVTILTLGAFNLLSIGILGEYVGRIAKEVRRRPLYIIDADSGAEPPAVAEIPETETWTQPRLQA
ncbi:MAG: glycosyltransferase family 2 protein [Sphingopyxis sp.]|nr:glycosyltransferase family 2 protein [Sphingopyxis sp.]